MVPDLVATLHATRSNIQFVSLTDAYTRALNSLGHSALELRHDRHLRWFLRIGSRVEFCLPLNP